MSTQQTPTLGQKFSETLKRIAVGLPLLLILFAGLRIVIGGMGAAAAALVISSIVVNVMFAQPEN